MKIDIISIKVNTWVDGSSSEDGPKYIPSSMIVDATINGVEVYNIMLPYIAVTDTQRINKKITETLYLE